MNEIQMTNNEIFSAMVDAEWAVVYRSFIKFMSLYKKGQMFNCLPEQPSEEQCNLAHKKFEELMEALGYL